MFEAVLGLLVALAGALWLVLKKLGTAKRDLEQTQRRETQERILKEVTRDVAEKSDDELVSSLTKRVRKP